MKAVFAFVKNWLIPILALLALALVIWFVGPLIAIGSVEPLASEGIRWTLIALIFVLWIGRKLYKAIKARRDAAKLMAGISEAPVDPTGAMTSEELAGLRQRMDDALAILKKAKLGGDEARDLYQLPWYIIIGPPGSGKTTALVNSGLNFPLAERFGSEAIRGVGGTRQCDWWFTDEAVLLDTAGRYTTQDSHEAVDKAAWLGFLEMLKNHRKRRPIDGAFIAISLSDLLLGTEAERAAHVKAIRSRLNELYQRLGVRFPVYVMLTKLDLVPGFMEFFDDLDRDDRRQVWGMSFPLDDGQSTEGVIGQFRNEFAALEQRLNERLCERLQREQDGTRRELIYGFPQQVGALRDSLAQFLEALFKPNPYDERVLLRGIYLTSGTQEGSPIDRMLGAMAGSMGLDRQRLTRPGGAGRAYFIERLFRDVAFGERGLVGTDPKVERRRAWITRLTLAASILLVLAMAGIWTLSYRANGNWLAETDGRTAALKTQIEALTPAQRDALSVVPLLDATQALTGPAPTWAQGWGLGQGDVIGDQAGYVYRKLLDNALLPRLTRRIEEQLRSGGNSDFLYEGLKAYLMLNSQAHYDPAFLKAWISLDWDQALPRDLPPEQRAALNVHLDALFARRPTPPQLDANLIADTRQLLAQVPLAQRVYDRIKRAPLPKDVEDFRISDAAGRDAPLVFTRKSGKPLNEGISGFYTYKGYKEAFLTANLSQSSTLAEEQWVLGRDAGGVEATAQLASDVRTLYFQDYQRQWQGLLSDLDFVPMTSPAQAADALRILSGPTSPLKRLLEAVAAQTDLTRQERLAQQAANKAVDGTVDKLKAQLGSLVGKADPRAAAAVSSDPVSDAFADLNALTAKDGDAPPSIDGILQTLNTLYVQMNALAGSSGQEIIGEAKNQAGAAAAQVALQAQRQPPFVQTLMKDVASASNSLMLGGVRNQLNGIWASDVVNFYRQSLAGRYPLAAGGKDAALEDFGQFFGVGGILDNFFRKYLQAYVDTSASTWRWQPGGAEKLGISPAVLVQFQQAAAIRDAFFRAGGMQPAVRFELRPVSMDASISLFQLDLDGQSASYDHGPIRPTAMQWPSPNGVGQVRLSISPPAAGGRSGLTFDGPWSWFRLLDTAHLTEAGSPDRFTVDFRIDQASIRYELRATSAFNPFGKDLFSSFRLPEKL